MPTPLHVCDIPAMNAPTPVLPADAPPTSRSPLLVRTAKQLRRFGVRGVGRIVRRYAASGRLEGLVVREPVAPGLLAYVPLFRNPWAVEHVGSYERELIRRVATATSELGDNATLIDCGANIGIVTMLIATSCPGVGRIVCLEPDPTFHSLLALNMSLLGRPVDVIRAAAGSVDGTGELRFPDYDRTENAQFVDASGDGSVTVLRVDSLDVDRSLPVLLKVDVEGGELAVLEGARQTIAEAPRLVVAFEAHPLVAARTGIDPCACIELIRSIRPCTATVAEHPDVRIDTSRPYFEQVPARRASNVVCTCP